MPFISLSRSISENVPSVNRISGRASLFICRALTVSLLRKLKGMLQITHISILAARQRQCHDGRACPLRACSTLRCVRFKSHTSLFSQHVKDSVTTAGLAPCERVFHAQVCALQITHISILAARQRQCHDGRPCPCERMFHALVCALHRTHLSLLVAHQRQRHDGRGQATCGIRSFH